MNQQKTWRGIILLAYKTNPLRFLLIQNIKSGNISPISGAIENGENHIEAIIREAKEEVNWDLTPNLITETNIEYEFIFGSNKPERQGDKGLYKVFFCNTDSLEEDAQITKDTKNPMWISKNEVLKHIKFEDLKEVISKALELQIY